MNPTLKMSEAHYWIPKPLAALATLVYMRGKQGLFTAKS